MKINAEFDSYEEMVEFARKFSQGTNASAGAAVVDTSTEPDLPKKEEKTSEDKSGEELPWGSKGEEPVRSKYTLPEVREKLASLQKAGKREQVKELIHSFGVKSLPEVPEDKYEELMEKAGEL